MKRALSYILFALLALAIVPLVVANRHDALVHVPVFGVELALPLYLVFFAGLFLGVVLMGVLAAAGRLRASLRASKAEREVQRLGQQLKAYENNHDKLV